MNWTSLLFSETPRCHASKRKCYPAACHEGIVGAGGIAPLILNLDSRWNEVVSFMSPPHVAHWIGGCVGPRATLDIVKKRKIPCPLPGIEPYVIQPVASSLWQLGCSGSPPTNILFKYITYCKCRRYKFSYSIPLLQFSCVLLLRIVMPTEISLHRLQ